MGTWISLEILKVSLLQGTCFLGRSFCFASLKKKAKPAVSVANIETWKFIYLLGIAITGMPVELRSAVKKQ